MDINEFTLLLDRTLKKATGGTNDMGNLTAPLSRPSGQLVELYGPMTDKLLKSRSKVRAQKLYDDNITNPAFLNAVQRLSDHVSSMGVQATNGAISSMGALVHLKDGFSSNLNTVLLGVKEPPNKLEGVLLAVADMTITSALAFVPVAGPFLVPLSQGINGMLSLAVTGGMTGIAMGSGNDSLLFMTGNAQMKSDQKTTINSDPGKQDLSDGATSAGKTIGDGIKNVTAFADKDGTFGQLAAQKGVASLIVTGIKIAIKKNDEKILKMADSADKSFAKLVGGAIFSQNQIASQEINTLGRLKIAMPASLAADPKRTNKYLSEKATLGEFKTTTARMFKDFYDLLVKIMNSGIEASFADAISGLNTPKFTQDSQKIALLILGYFYAKDWDGSRAAAKPGELGTAQQTITAQQQILLQQQQRLGLELQGTGGTTWENYKLGDINNRSLIRKWDSIDRLKIDMSTTEGEIQRNQMLVTQLSVKSGLSTYLPKVDLGSSGRAALELARNASSKKGVLLDNFAGLSDIEKLPTIESKAMNYFKAMKSALTADIESTMVKGNNGFLGDDEFQKMWKLYIGSQLIVNHALNDSKIKIQSGGLRKFGRALTPTTDATAIPDYYVKMIEDGGFIERYSSWTGTVSTDRKKQLAATGRMRWSRSPSNTERAMLITFCTVVAFTLDVGKISLGFYSWDETVAGLKDVCKTISATAYTA